MCQKVGLIRRWIAVAFLCISGPALANDLIIENFAVTLDLDGVQQSGAFIGYVPALNTLHVDTDLAVSWDCDEHPTFHTCSPRPNFTAKVFLHLDKGAAGTEQVLVDSIAMQGATDVQYRNESGPYTSESKQSRAIGMDGNYLFNRAITDARHYGYTLTWLLIIDTEGVVVEDTAPGEDNNESSLEEVPVMYALNGNIRFGNGVSVQLDSITAAHPDFVNCGAGSGSSGARPDVAIDGTSSLSLSTSSAWPDQTIILVNQCTSFFKNGDLLELDSKQAYSFGDVSGSISGIDVELESLALTDVQGTSTFNWAGTTVQLPSGLSQHDVDVVEGGPVHRGLSAALIETVSLLDENDFDTLQLSDSNKYIHSENLPFSIHYSSLTLSSSDPTGLKGVYDTVHYPYDRNHHPEDTRLMSLDGPISNDRRFSNPDAPSAINDDFLIDSNGLQITKVTFLAPGSTTGHFPKMTIKNFLPFDVGVTNGSLNQDQSPLTVDNYEIGLSQDCPKCDGGDIESTIFTINPLTPEVISGDGAVIAHGQFTQNPYWGPSTNGANPVFSRQGDKGGSGEKGIMYIPGHIATGTAQSSNVLVSDSLMGSRGLFGSSASQFTPYTHYPLNSIHARRGNGFMPGFTRGPQELIDSNNPVNGVQIGFGQSLVGTSTTIRLGGTSCTTSSCVITVNSNEGAKYVMRPAGLTGTFNHVATTEAANVYGYGMAFKDLTFRQVSNNIDSYSWINGDIYVPGKGQFDIVFESLGLECSGNLAEGLVAFEGRPGASECLDNIDNNLNGYSDENCEQSFAAWNADIELISMLFAPVDSTLSMCTDQSRILQVGNTIKMNALDRALGMTAKWSSSGDPSDAQVFGVTDHVLDSPKGQAVPDEEKDTGFNFALRSDMALRTPSSGGIENATDTDGWLAVSGDLGVPFWDSLDVSARLANLNNTEQEQTIISKRGVDLTGSDDDKSNATLVQENAMKAPNNSNDDISAVYQWGNTPFKMDLPVYYLTGRTTGLEANRTKPLFFGRDKSLPMVVMEINSGINFISADQTRISFGASADFSRVPNLSDGIDLHIDFNDPDSVQNVDTFLCDTFPLDCPSAIEQRPVGKIFYTLNQQFDLLNSVVGAGLDEFLEQGINSALNSSAVNLELDNISNALGSVHALPDRLASSVSTGFSKIADEVIEPLSGLARIDDNLFDPPDSTDPTLDAAMVQLYLDMPMHLINAQSNIKALNPVSDATKNQLLIYQTTLGDTLSAIESARNAITGVDQDIDEVERQIVAAFDSASADVTGEVARATEAIDALIGQISNLTNGANGILGSCDIDVINPVSGNNLLMQQVGKVHQRLSSVQSKFGNLNLLDFGKLIAAIAGIDLNAINSASRDVQDRIEDLVDSITDVQTGIESICALDGLASELSAAAGSSDQQDLSEDTALGLLRSIRSNIAQVNTAVANIRAQLIDNSNSTLGVLRAGLAQVVERLDSATEEILKLHQTIVDARNDVMGPLDWSDTAVTDLQADLDGLFITEEITTYRWYYATMDSDPSHSFVRSISDSVRQSVDLAIFDASRIANEQLASLIATVPQPSADELRSSLVNLIMNSSVIESLDTEINLQLSKVLRPMTNVIVGAADHINYVLRKLVEGLAGEAQKALEEASASVTDGLPVESGKIDGYGLITGEHLERIHLGAEWTLKGEEEESSSTFDAALDVFNISENDQSQGCGIGNAAGTLSVIISSNNLPIKIGFADTTVRELELGFSIGTDVLRLYPVGLMGSIFLDGFIGFEKFKLYDLGLAAGVGQSEAYLGATGSGEFDAYEFSAAFLVGKTCSPDILTSLDPKAVVTIPNGIFNGAYVRGAATVPIYPYTPPYTCALTVKVGADLGAWALIGPPLTYGGLVGGSASGQVACLASLRGQVTILGEKSGDQFTFIGEGFGVGGIGADCDPGTWTSVGRSRGDDWCGTGDASFKAEYKDGWKVSTPKPSALH